MAPTCHQKGQFEHKFQKMVRCYNFFKKWAILTQNSPFLLVILSHVLTDEGLEVYPNHLATCTYYQGLLVQACKPYICQPLVQMVKVRLRRYKRLSRLILASDQIAPSSNMDLQYFLYQVVRECCSWILGYMLDYTTDLLDVFCITVGYYYSKFLHQIHYLDCIFFFLS